MQEAIPALGRPVFNDPLTTAKRWFKHMLTTGVTAALPLMATVTLSACRFLLVTWQVS